MEEIRQMANSLSKAKNEKIVLLRLLGFSDSEIAKKVGISTSSVFGYREGYFRNDSTKKMVSVPPKEVDKKLSKLVDKSITEMERILKEESLSKEVRKILNAYCNYAEKIL
jgi:hypothetical protein